MYKRIADTTYRLQDCRNPRKKLVVHFDRLKRCTEDTRMEQSQAAIREEQHKPWKQPKSVRRVTGLNERITQLDGDDDTPPLTPEVEDVLPPDRIDAPLDPARPINHGGGAPNPEAPVLEPHADGHRTIIGDPSCSPQIPRTCPSAPWLLPRIPHLRV